MVEMVYNTDEQADCLDDLIRQMLELLSSLRADTDPKFVRDLERFICQDILNLLADYFIRFKNPVF